MDKIILIGAGALARDIVGVFGHERFVGLYVDPQFQGTKFGELPVLSNWADVRKIATCYVLGVSDIAHRDRVRLMARAEGLHPCAPLVPPSAIVAADARLASGSAIGQMVVIGPAARLGEDSIVMHSAIVAHDSVIGENTVLCAGVCIGGHVQVGAQTFVGSNAVLAPKVKFGAGCYIAAGAACFRDADPGSRWIGNPARRSNR